MPYEQWSAPEFEVLLRFGWQGEDWPELRMTVGTQNNINVSGSTSAYSRTNKRQANKKLKKNKIEARRLAEEGGINLSKAKIAKQVSV